MAQSSARIALDSNILVYAEGVDDAARYNKATQLLHGLGAGNVVIPVQALGELFNVLTRKARWPAPRARAAVLAWADAYGTVGTTPDILPEAMEIACSHQLSFWDAVMLAVAAQSGGANSCPRTCSTASPGAA